MFDDSVRRMLRNFIFKLLQAEQVYIWLKERFLASSGLQSSGHIDWVKFASVFNVLCSYDNHKSATKQAVKTLL
jgi:hypothetical protein